MSEVFVSKAALSEAVYLSMHDNPHKDGKIRHNHNMEHHHFLHMIHHAPAANVEPIVNAFWKKRVSHGAYWYACSNCDEKNPRDRYGHDYFSRRCPHCGAHMDFEREATDE